METYDSTKNYDKALHVRFHLHPCLQQDATASAGRPQYKDKVYIEIISPGDPKSVVDRPMHEQDKYRFPERWRAFEAGHGDVMEGTPLAAWGLVTPSQIEELAYFRVRTVEQLASLSDSGAQNIGPILKLREAARDFVQRTEGNAPFLQLQAQAEKQQEEIEALKVSAKAAREKDAEIEDLRRQIAEQSKELADQRRKGR
jgi:hypothetical protein